MTKPTRISTKPLYGNKDTRIFLNYDSVAIQNITRAHNYSIGTGVISAEETGSTLLEHEATKPN